VLFILAHGIMVFVTGLRQNTNNMFIGEQSNGWAGFPLFVVAMILVGLAWWVASPFTIQHARLVQWTGRFMVGWIKGLSEWWEPNAQLTEKDISPHFWPNGTMPNSAEFEALVADEFAHYRLRVSGLVEEPRGFSFADLKALPKQEQITTHFCIQGWSGVAKWGGVSMSTILDLVTPDPQAEWVVFYSLGEGADGGTYYDAHPIEQMRSKLAMLAYDMNDEPLSFGHGAPLRLRNEIELGFKQVKWVKGVEFVADFSDIGSGLGGYNQDHEFFGYRQSL
jgi:DMSO/TMAO reductase YedYZ molybdopterin-dependent catalytic subunit